MSPQKSPTFTASHREIPQPSTPNRSRPQTLHPIKYTLYCWHSHTPHSCLSLTIFTSKATLTHVHPPKHTKKNETKIKITSEATLTPEQTHVRFLSYPAAFLLPSVALSLPAKVDCFISSLPPPPFFLSLSFCLWFSFRCVHVRARSLLPPFCQALAAARAVT